MPTASERAWWRDGVLYQIYPRSFRDSDGDGTGDLRGVIERLDHLEWLGVDGIWLNPVMSSPNADWGYDVADYCAVHPDLGTLADVDDLVAEAGRRGIRVIFDLVPNHTSDEHAWFLDSRSSRSARHRDWYVWADPRADGRAPNNWLSSFGGPAWTLDEATGQFYLHNFAANQPDLNWWNDKVRDAFDSILRFWFDRGIAGFRIDVTHAIVKDRELRDNPAVEVGDHGEVRKLGQRQVFSMNRPEVHDVLRRWRALAGGYDSERILVGETYVLDLDQMVSYYGTGADELHGAFNFLFVFAPFAAEAMRQVVEGVEARIPAAAWPVWTGSNHDAGRLATRWCDGRVERVRCALLMLLALRGTPFLYQGDEIGLPEVQVPREAMRDLAGSRGGAEPARGRDRCRTPMQWTAEQGAGFTAAGARPWLPLGDAAACNVADQRADTASVLHFCRDIIALRRASPELQRGEYRTLPAPTGAWAWRRGERTTAAVNLSGEEVRIPDVVGRIAVATDRARDGEAVARELWLAPWSGAIVAP